MLITLEGLDGSGKTTVREGLAESHPDATFTREPTDSWYGDAVRRSIGTPEADPLAELFLYTADHAHHLAETVRPALEAGELVVSDRYSDSRFAYQAASLEGVVDEPMTLVRSIHRPWSRAPDATIYLDVDPEVGAERSGETNKFEQVQFLRRVHEHYERLVEAEPERFVRIDANRDRAAVVEDVRQVVASLVE